MASFYEAARLYTSKIQHALGTQFLIFYAFDNNSNKRGIFVVDLGSLPTLDPNDQQGLANAIKQNMKKLVFQNDNDPAVDELALDGHGHIMFDVNGNDNLLCIGWGHEVSSRNYVVTLAALRKGGATSPDPKFIQFEKCPNASRPINNIDNIDDLKVLVIGNDPKLVHIAKVNNTIGYSIEMAGH